ncbi:hypothetical protein ABFA07_012447 [Porites harrisoni]
MKLFIILSLCVLALSTVNAEGGGYEEPDEYWSRCLSKRYGNPNHACGTGYKRLAKATQAGAVSGCNYWEWSYFCSKTHTKAYWQGTAPFCGSRSEQEGDCRDNGYTPSGWTSEAGDGSECLTGTKVLCVK